MRSGKIRTGTFLALALALALGAARLAARAGDAQSEGGKFILFNGKDLSGWTIHIAHRDGSNPASDPRHVFTVEDGLIHVSGEEFGGITTVKEYENYRLSLEFRWGTKRWPP